MVKQRLEQLRRKMKNEGIDFCLIPSTDYHASEYIAGYFKVSEYFSGCTSDNVTLIVSEDNAYLWTDGRYFISAAAELEGSGIELMKSGEPDVPTVRDFLMQSMKQGEVLGYDGRVLSALRANEYRNLAGAGGWQIQSHFDPAEGIWEDRPALPAEDISILSDDQSGENAADKISRIRKEMEAHRADMYVVTALDEIMWTLNLRGSDILYNPVALSFLVLECDGGRVYLRREAFRERKEELTTYLNTLGLSLGEYGLFFEELSGREDINGETRVMFTPGSISDRIVEELIAKSAALVPVNSPIAAMKAVKNETELNRIRDCYLRDSAALCRFIYDVKKTVGEEHCTELSLAQKLRKFRAEIPDFLGLSFETISAYNENAAIVHYAPSTEHDKEVKPEGLLLVDSGGQYESGTTDVTRTIVLGDITKEMKRDFTLVAVANLRLLTAKFMYGCTGANLDMYVRAPLWEKGMDFKHGTGHGIGYILNVHEGPQNIGWKIAPSSGGGRPSVGATTVFESGMITSDEPGIYREGKYGIRTESVVECVEDESNEFGRFLRLRPLTFVPIDKEALDLSLMEEGDKCRLNEYHRAVYRRIAPLLKDEEERRWLADATAEI